MSIREMPLADIPPFFSISHEELIIFSSGCLTSNEFDFLSVEVIFHNIASLRLKTLYGLPLKMLDNSSPLTHCYRSGQDA